MTKLLEKAVEALNKLPEERQDLYASEILADLKDDEIWQKKFAQTTPEAWANIDKMFQAEAKSSSATLPEWAIDEIIQLSANGELNKPRLHHILEEAAADLDALAEAEQVLEEEAGQNIPWETVKKELGV